MIGYILLAITLMGTSYAAYLDLKTTEVPDLVSVLVASAGLLLNGVLSYVYWDASFILSSLAVGSLFFGLGWLAYLGGMWGGADAFVLGAVGFALPKLPPGFAPAFEAHWPFALTLFINMAIVGTVYIFGYAVYKGLTSRRVMEGFAMDMKGYWKKIASVSALYVVVALGLTFYLAGRFAVDLGSSLGILIGYLPLLVGLLLMYRYLRLVEDAAMRKEIDMEELEEGDVLAEDVELDNEVLRAKKIVGLTAEQVEEIRRQSSRESVPIRYGVRFVPVFPVAVAVSVLFGDMLFFLLKMIA